METNKKMILSDGRAEFERYLKIISRAQPLVHEMKDCFDDSVENQESFSQDWYTKLLFGGGTLDVQSIHTRIVNSVHPADRPARIAYYGRLLDNLKRSVYEAQEILNIHSNIEDISVFPMKYRDPKQWPVDEEGNFIFDLHNGYKEFERSVQDPISLEILEEYQSAVNSFYRIHSLLNEKGIPTGIMAVVRAIRIDIINDGLSYDAEAICRSIY